MEWLAAIALAGIFWGAVLLLIWLVLGGLS